MQKHLCSVFSAVLVAVLITLLFVSTIHAHIPSTIVAWTLDLRGFVTDSNPALYGPDSFYIGSTDGRVYKINVTSRAIPWHFSTGNQIVTTPAVSPDGSVVYITSYDSKYYAINAATGATIWGFSTGLYFLASSPALADGGKVFVFGGSSDFALYGVNAATGAILWRFVNSGSGRYYSTAAVSTASLDGETTVYIGSTDDNVYALDARTGTVKWTHTTGGDIYASPIFTMLNGTIPMIYVGNDDRYMYAIHAETGALLWKHFTSDKIRSAAVVHQNSVYFGNQGGTFFAVGASAGELQWKVEVSGSLHAGPTLLLGSTAASGKDLLFVPSTNGKVFALRLDGTVDWIYQKERDVFSSRAVAWPAGASATHLLIVSQLGIFVSISLATADELGYGRGYGTVAASHKSGTSVSKAVVVGIPIAVVLLVVVVAGATWCISKQRQEGREQEERNRQMRARNAEQRRGGRDRPQTPPILGIPNMEAVEGRPVGRNDQEMQLFTQYSDPIGREHNYCPPPPVSATVNPQEQQLQQLEAQEQMLRKWRDSFTKAIKTGQTSIQLEWEYITRLTRNFAEFLVTHSKKSMEGIRARHEALGMLDGGVQLFIGSEFVEGVLMQFVAKVVGRPRGAMSQHGVEPLGTLPEELRLLTKLRHKNLVRVYGFAIDNGGLDNGGNPNQVQSPQSVALLRYCVVMEKLEGGTISGILQDKRKASYWSAKQRIYVALGVAYGLKHMHSKAIFHRDIKSANVMLRGNNGEEGVLIDFDISCESLGLDQETGLPQTMRMTSQRRVFGTPGYICPDYARMFCGYGISQEIYSLGVFILELLTGRLSNPSEIDITDPEVNGILDPRIKWGYKMDAVLKIAREMTKVKSRERPSLNTVIFTLQAWLKQIEEAGTDSTALDLQQTILNSNAAAGLGQRQGSASLSQTTIACGICGIDVEEEGGLGVECSDAQRHYMCAECLNNRISALLDTTDKEVDLLTLGCSMPGCSGHWFFGDFASRLTPNNIKRWHLRSVEMAKRSGQAAAQETYNKLLEGQGNLSEIRQHTEQVRALLRPKCPHCGLVFESFSGCTTVTCGVKQHGRVIRGCGKQFCGACMTPKPCPANHGHEFLSPLQLHDCWKVWRRQVVTQYLVDVFASPRGGRMMDSGARTKYELLLESTKMDLQACGIYPIRLPEKY